MVFPNDALVPVGLAFDTVLERVPCFGEQANDLEESALCVFLMPIRQKADHLSNRELVGCHRTSQPRCDTAPERRCCTLYRPTAL